MVFEASHHIHIGFANWNGNCRLTIRIEIMRFEWALGAVKLSSAYIQASAGA